MIRDFVHKAEGFVFATVFWVAVAFIFADYDRRKEEKKTAGQEEE